jgi:S1-C subfamily serine protease
MTVMTPPTDDQTRQPKLLGSPALKIRIALGSGLLLAVGAWLAPRAAPTPLSVPQERAAPLLEEQVQAREVVQPFRGVQDVAARIKGRGVAIPPEPWTASIDDFSEAADPSQPAGFGAFVSDVYVLTHADALSGRAATDVITADGRRLPARAVAHEPATGLVLLQTEPSRAAIDPIATATPAPGTLAVAAAPSPPRDIAVPVFVTSSAGDRVTVAGVSNAVLPGMPVYTVDGELLAIASGNQRGDAYSIGAAANRLMTRAASGPPTASFGIGFQPLHGLLTRMYGESGVLINHVVDDGPADRAGIRVGDVLVAVGDTEIDSIETAARALGAPSLDTPATLRVRRAGRDRVIEVMPAASYEVAVRARAASDALASGIRAGVLWPRSVLDQAAIPAAAWVLAINGRPSTSRGQAERDLLRARGPVSVWLRHGDSRFFVAIEPAR